MSGKHTAERKQAVDKLRSEGKITGKFATSKDYETIPELKDLKAKQDAEKRAQEELKKAQQQLKNKIKLPW